MPTPTNSSSNGTKNRIKDHSPGSPATTPNVAAAGSAGSSAEIAANASRFRHRKISVKQRLKIYRPNDLKSLNQNELQEREMMEIETGMEKNEEKEVHLNRILQKGANLSDESRKREYIPTPKATATWTDFDKFYQGRFKEPSSYIKFSATLEECCGAPYSMDEKDEEFLEGKINAGKEKEDEKLSEDEFEILCSSFESAIHERQPFLSMDPETILSFEELKPTLLKADLLNQQLKQQLGKEIGYKEDQIFTTQLESIDCQSGIRPLSQVIEKFGVQVYEYWKQRKINSSNTEIFPQLRFERPDEKDDSNPYVCFRRRDVRQPRKTRRVDILNSQKLRLLHQELEHAKDMALLVARREKVTLDLLEQNMRIFDQRSNVKRLKRSLGIRGEDEDLVNHKRKRLNVVAQSQMKQNAGAAGAAEAAVSSPASSSTNAVTTSDSSVKRGLKGRILKKNLEHLAKSGQKLTKQQLQQLQAQNLAIASGKHAGHMHAQQVQQAQQAQQALQAQQAQQAQQQQQQEQPQVQQSQQAQQGQSIQSHVYVRLPSSKVPDITLDDVDHLLTNKERNARKFVHDRMEKRKLEDKDLFNLTDDPYNPVFDITLPKDVLPNNSPFSSIASSKYEINRSYYCGNLPAYLNGNTDDITAYNHEGEKLPSNNFKVKKLEVYDPFQTNNEIHSKEYPVKFRKRVGRCGIQYIDRKPNHMEKSVDSVLNQFLDFDAIESQEQNPQETINVYDSKWDEFSRLYDKWQHDSPRNEYGLKVLEEPSRLNQISNETQVIRFGTMLGSKSYEQLRDVTIKYRQEYVARMRQQKLNQKQLQLQQQQQQQIQQEQEQEQELQQQEQEQQQQSQHARSPSLSATSSLSQPSSKMESSPAMPKKVNGISNQHHTKPHQGVPVTQKKSS
ncbi:hypothetical protein ZYGR_0S00400 [Zygosaccharomyces rouxii]|uniref:Enhancer of polycomb-like protein n=2 Tax=Zygosaccharomyces rouxii TaxID=4956 RepID=C5DX99_ZYGRC|nr:uncharacterized protein ZYRO0F03344g [Zygosaccharomyces rouxii]KAH9199174.1 enhancer of polycomb-like-domain-containing protein [Zygosaccharomyces rouxii]GAV49907.1 hypothetical protein ZYGR_0S00400 [Zygosaccharomyces rouxii]CAR28410.1 ZYRO0F03344p [Zygosaccharomyces rouxii]